MPVKILAHLATISHFKTWEIVIFTCKIEYYTLMTISLYYIVKILITRCGLINIVIKTIFVSKRVNLLQLKA